MTAGVPFSLVTFSWARKRKVLYMDVLMLRSQGCEGAATRHQAERMLKETLNIIDYYNA
jgi:hypothetical protein